MIEVVKMNYNQSKAEATRIIRDNPEMKVPAMKLLIQTKYGLSGKFVDKTLELIKDAEE